MDFWNFILDIIFNFLIPGGGYNKNTSKTFAYVQIVIVMILLIVGLIILISRF